MEAAEIDRRKISMGTAMTLSLCAKGRQRSVRRVRRAGDETLGCENHVANALRHRLEQCQNISGWLFDDRPKAADGRLITATLRCRP